MGQHLCVFSHGHTPGAENIVVPGCGFVCFGLESCLGGHGDTKEAENIGVSSSLLT